MNPKYTVIIPSYNRESTIGHCLKSVLAQSYRDFEIIVIDNNSTDSTCDVVRGFNSDKIRLYGVENNGIVAVSRNLGIAKSKGDFLCFLDSDDMWLPNKLEVVDDLFSQGYDFVYHDFYIINDVSCTTKKRTFNLRNIEGRFFDDLIENGNSIVNSGVVIRKAILGDEIRLNTSSELSGCEDFVLWLDLFRVTNAVIKLEPTLGYYLQDGNNFSNPNRSLINSQALVKLMKEEYDKRDVPNWLAYKYNKALLDSNSKRFSPIYTFRYGINSISLKNVIVLFLLKVRYYASAIFR